MPCDTSGWPLNFIHQPIELTIIMTREQRALLCSAEISHLKFIKQ